MTGFSETPLYLGLPLKGVHAIEASAGTGKTTTLALLYLSVILSGVSPENVLVVTFTRAAAQDVRERIRTLLEDVRKWRSGSESEMLPDLLAYLETLETDPLLLDRRLREALAVFDRAPIQTIHSFCQSLLRQMSFLLGTPADLVLVPEDRPVLYESSVRLWRSIFYGRDPLLAAFLLSVWDTGPGGWVRTFRTVSARRGDWETCFRPVEEAMEQYRGRRQAFREALGIGFSGLFREGLPDRLRDLLGDREVPALGLSEDDKDLGEAFPPGGDALQELLERTLRAARELQEVMRSSFLDLAGVWKHRELREREIRGLATYDDLILRVAESLEQESAAQRLRDRFPVAFVDESQDTSRDQSGIFARIYRDPRPGSALFWIGDPKQSIYRFRGADVEAYLEFSRQSGSCPENPPIRLSVNYRSSPGILHAVNRLFGRHPAPFLLEGVSYHPSTPVPGRTPELVDPEISGSCFLVYPGRGPKDRLDDFARLTADEVERLLSGRTFLNDRPLSASDIAVLVPKNVDGERVAGFLRERGIPYNSASLGSVFHTREADEIATVLDALLSPWRMPSLCLALGTRLFGWNAREIDRLTRDPEQARPVQETFLESSRLWRTHGIRAAFRELFFRMGVWPGLLSQGQTRQRIDRLVDRIERASGQFPTPSDQHRFFSRARLALEGESHEETVGGEAGTGVHLLTVHKSKGLEFPVVFVPFGIPEKKRKEEETSRDEEEGGDSDQSESLRLLYVALTRARERVYLFCPLNRVKQSALDHLLKTDRYLDGRREKTVTEKRFHAMREALEEAFSGVDGVAFFAPRESPKEENLKTVEETAGKEDEVVVRSLSRPLPVPRRVTSFTAIVARGEDSDTWNGIDPLIGDEDGEDLSGNLEDRPGPAGRAFGVFVHGVLEEAGKWIVRYKKAKKISPSRADVRAWIRSSFSSRVSDDGEGWTESALEMAEQGLFAPLLPMSGLPLADLLDDRSRFEEPFLLRLPDEEKDGEREVASHLRGVIDVVVWSGQTVFLIDYKTNLLTGEENPYSPESLVRVLSLHRYDLQARIYSEACRRHLALTGREGEFGGFLFLFLRGMGREGGSGTLLWTPPKEEEA
ncbi:UvrD-helicase domain-containing protein [Leptospirillum ferriphilum]|uniref:DNA 3'-5' helicase n=1 Tax=Leptospirillum ferriphilum TaxID=178606 RepID=A0A1V3SYN4_9BACT|nr:UvrD-helicase domain-containing protein [Leptospirillum ferriphilum]OOH74287.1 hypothetical protein BOX24_02265 [Leptospirillum ferriphilum]